MIHLQFKSRSLACRSLALTLLLGVVFLPAAVEAQSGYTTVSTTSPATATPITVLVPHSYSSSVQTPLVIYFHGGGETQTAIVTGLLNQYGVVSALTNAGFIVAGSASTGIYEYGAQPALDDYVDLYNYVVAHYNIGKVLFLSQSNGGMAGLNLFTQWTIPNVVAWAGIFPNCNLGWFYNDYPGGPGYVNPTYGITGGNGQTYTNLTTGYDPALDPGLAFHNAYLRFYASPEDTVILKVDNSDVIAAHAASSTLESIEVVCMGIMEIRRASNPQIWSPSTSGLSLRRRRYRGWFHNSSARLRLRREGQHLY